MKDIIIKLIREIKPYEEIDENTELIESGILDSLAIIGLITELEDTFEIEIPDDAVTKVNFTTIQTIIKLVEESNGEYRYGEC